MSLLDQVGWKSRVHTNISPLKNLSRFIGITFFLGFLILELTGCASTARKRQYCESVNVYKKGYMHGSKGLPTHFFKSYQEKCGDYVDIQPMQVEYKKGWKKAIKVFCTEKGGYELGLKGGQYHRVCSKEVESVFLTGYKKGARKCLYEWGYQSALNDKPDSYGQSTCPKLEGKQSSAEYKKGHQKGLKIFCGYKNGYKWGLEGKSYKTVCSQKAGFFKGYRAGDRKCLYGAGYDHALAGRSSAFDQSACQKLKGHKKSYRAGRVAGIRVFCTYKSGYNHGLKGYRYENICPKVREESFFKGYTLGYQEYKAEKRQQEILQLERERMRAEERARQEALAVERERIAVERERIAAEVQSRSDIADLKRKQDCLESRNREQEEYSECLEECNRQEESHCHCFEPSYFGC